LQGRRTLAAPLIALLCGLSACGPRARIPALADLPPLPLADSAHIGLARRIAPLIYRQRDESFRLERVVAVVHPTRPVIAYHLLWRDDAHGAWLPFTIPTDQEIVWIQYDASGAPTDVWTYWHGTVIHAPVPRAQVIVNVQWGKHGSFPRGMPEGDFPTGQGLALFYVFSYALPDLAFGLFMRPGPICFCRGYRRYRDFSAPIPLAARIDAVVRIEDPDPVLREVFGIKYSRKRTWPW